MRIIVGSNNPVKIAAAKGVFHRIDSANEISSFPALSGVSNQPWGEIETRLGALNRARASLTDTADLGVGFEGGVTETEYGLMSCAWCCVVDHQGTVGFGGGVYMLLPEAAEDFLRQGLELGDVMDMLIDEHNTKQREGAVGILTDGLIDRQLAYEDILKMALTPFRRPDIYFPASK